ncbi:MAG: response regulator [Candidatus Omnitrophota bacterium]
MPKKILVVDDEPHIVKLVESRLRASGYEVICAFDGKMALETARKEKPDLIILDLMLPQMDGYKVCGLLKKDAKYSAVPVIIFSARAQEEDQTLAEEVGANAYITKPFKPEELLDKIKELLKE